MKKRIFALLLCLALLLSACGTEPQTGESETGSNSGGSGSTGNSGTSVSQGEPGKLEELNVEDLFSDRDLAGTYEENKSATIKLSGSSAATDSKSVTIKGGTVTVTGEGTYVVSGKLDNGMIIVDADKKDKVQLVLKDAAITSSTSAAIYVRQADKVFITLVGENTLENTSGFEDIDDNNIDAVIFSKDDMTVNGTGKLHVVSPSGNGITGKDELTITGGNITVDCAGHGLEGKDSVAIADGSFTLTCGKDGIHAENNDDAAKGYAYIGGGSFDIEAEGDGISAASCMQIDGGTYRIVTGGGAVNGEKKTSDNWGGFGGGRGGSGGPGGRPGGGMGGGESGSTSEDSTSIKGIKAGGELLINSGSFTIDSADDAVHSNADLTVCGGTFDIASGDDGFHADEALTISAGEINISESYEGLEGMNIAVSGGNIRLKSFDDGINAAGGTDGSGFGGNRGGDMFGGGMGGGSSDGSIEISGGTIYMNASGDGIDANGTLTISGGHTTVCGPTQGDTAVLDYDRTATITGGTFIGTGSYMMAQTFSASEQGVIALSVGNQSAGTRITLSDKSGKLLIDYEPALSYAIVILSTPEMVKGESYTVTVGSLSDEFQAS